MKVIPYLCLMAFLLSSCTDDISSPIQNDSTVEADDKTTDTLNLEELNFKKIQINIEDLDCQIATHCRAFNSSLGEVLLDTTYNSTISWSLNIKLIDSLGHRSRYETREFSKSLKGNQITCLYEYYPYVYKYEKSYTDHRYEIQMLFDETKSNIDTLKIISYEKKYYLSEHATSYNSASYRYDTIVFSDMQFSFTNDSLKIHSENIAQKLDYFSYTTKRSSGDYPISSSISTYNIEKPKSIASSYLQIICF